jgi:hypothetical protein
MFPFLDFGAVAFVLFAGFGLGVLLGWALRDRESRPSHDGDGGELAPATRAAGDVRARNRFDDGRLAEIIPFPRRRRAG